MGVKKPSIRSMKYEEFKNNDYLEEMMDELRKNGTNVVLTSLDQLINWGRSNSVWSFLLGTSCCAIELWRWVLPVTIWLVSDSR